MANFQTSFIFGLMNKFAIKPLPCFPPHINYLATLTCEIKNSTFIILPLQLLQKRTSKFLYFFT